MFIRGHIQSRVITPITLDREIHFDSNVVNRDLSRVPGIEPRPLYFPEAADIFLSTDRTHPENDLIQSTSVSHNDRILLFHAPLFKDASGLWTSFSF